MKKGKKILILLFYISLDFLKSPLLILGIPILFLFYYIDVANDDRIVSPLKIFGLLMTLFTQFGINKIKYV